MDNIETLEFAFRTTNLTLTNFFNETGACTHKQVGGLGKPANLHAYFKGPLGNKLCK